MHTFVAFRTTATLQWKNRMHLTFAVRFCETFPTTIEKFVHVPRCTRFPIHFSSVFFSIASFCRCTFLFIFLKVVTVSETETETLPRKRG